MALATTTPRRDPARTLVMEEVKNAVLDGRLKPGQRLTELDLAQQFGVSQGTVREALRLLEPTGLVETKPHRGTWVKNYTPKEIEQACQLRTALEGFAAHLVVARGNPPLDRLRRLAGTIKQAAVSDDLESYLSAGLDFHRALVEATDNDLIVQSWCSICMPVRSWLLSSGTSLKPGDESWRAHVGDHDDIVNAIEAGDPDEARRTTERHLTRVALALGWSRND